MMTEDLEFQISQYSDGSLPAEQRAVVEELIRTDSAAQKVLGDYQKLDLHFASLRPVPAVRWERLADHLSNSIRSDQSARPVVAGRIFRAVSSWQIRSAVAAVVVFAVGGMLWMKGHRGTPPAGAVEKFQSTALITGPQAEVANAPAVQEIKIGPSPALAQHLDSWRYADGVVTHGPSKVTITAGITPPPHIDPHLH